jgi:hypothetical protein
MRKLNFLFSIIVAFVLLPAVLAGAPAPTQDTLPANFASWTAAGSETAVPSGSLLASPSVLQEYGLANASTRSYSHGAATLQVILYRLKDPTGAYGLYSYLRSSGLRQGSIHAYPPALTVLHASGESVSYQLSAYAQKGDFHRADVTDHSVIAPGRALILQGSFVLDVLGPTISGSEVAGLKNLAAAVAPSSNPGPYPTLYGHLPQSAFVVDSDCYILGPAALHEYFPVADGDWLGFGSGVEAEVASYRINGEDLTLLIADFPTPQVATKKMEEWTGFLDVGGLQNGSGKPVVYAKRSLTLVGLVFKAHSQTQAALILDHVHTGAELTWNEPGFSLNDPNIGNVLVGIIYGTGFLCGFALVAGLAFGGVRIAVKRLLPGRVFDRGDQLDVLQLGLGSKPINSEDFYGISGSTRP